MRNAHTVAEVRTAERALMAQLPDGALMQRAAAGLATACAGLLGRVYGSRVVVLAGSGDNGGDALYAAAMLSRRGATVTAVSTGSKTHAGGTAAVRESGGELIETADQAARDAIGAADLIIDGMLGIGGSGGIREPGASLAALAARADAVVVATDLPSGIDADTGVVDGAAVRADVTITFGTWKPCLLIDPGAAHAGVVELIDIGLGPHLGPPDVIALQEAEVAACLPRPSAESDKYRRGVLGIVAGSDRFTGAATLAIGGAISGGAGMVRLVCTEPAAVVARQHWPEAVITVAADDPERTIEAAGRVQAWVAGPGMGTGDDAAGLLAAVLATNVPVLVDADGLTMLAAHRGLLPRAAPTLITPHAGELARLLSADRKDVEARRLWHARVAADKLGCAVLLKGSTTVIAAQPGAASPGAAQPGVGQPGVGQPGAGQPGAGLRVAGPTLVNPTGTAWLATAGSGDVLSGLAGALLAQGLAPQQAAAVAAYLHGMAGRLAADDAPIGASELIRALPAAFRTVVRGKH